MHRNSTAIKTILFSLLVPGTVVGVIPWLMLTRGPTLPFPSIGCARILGSIPIVSGVLFFAASAWNFVTRGKGTPAPIDPPKQLVISGPYRFVRNPMYAGGILILLGETILFKSALLFFYLCFIWLAFHLFVVLYEEPHLRTLFGTAYSDYCREVNRWMPGFGRKQSRRL